MNAPSHLFHAATLATLDQAGLAEAPAAEARVREKLLAAAAHSSRLLLQAPDTLKVMNDVLRLLGQAADVHRTVFALAELDSGGERWLVIRNEWISDELKETCEGGESCSIGSEQYSDVHCEFLRAGKSIVYCRDTMTESQVRGITSNRAQSSAVVPILVDGEYVGVIGFDDWRHARQFDSSIVSTLEIAAGLVGAALHRERLMDTVRREREQAAEERIAQANRANAMLRANLTRLAGNPDVRDFLANMLRDASQQLGAAAGFAAGFDDEAKIWRMFVHVENEEICEPPYATTCNASDTAFAAMLETTTEPTYLSLAELEKPLWPNIDAWHKNGEHRSIYLLPLVFGERNMGFIGVVFCDSLPLDAERMQVLLALAHQATLAIGIKKLGIAAKNAAVLAERNRIGQEIHDGLAQGFTGILMQLGAAEEAMRECARNSPLPAILTRIRDLAKEGLTEARRSVLALKLEQTRRVGLELALRQLAERSQMPGRVNFEFEGGVAGDGPAPEHQHELLRIAQEAVANALRHAHPTRVNILLAEDETSWTLIVSDDGRGMTLTPDLYERQGFGLTNMRERAGAIGGKFAIESAPDAGTRIVVSLPRKIAK
jgi:signal transduction histidine kinase